jgi:hypothetical protein
MADALQNGLLPRTQGKSAYICVHSEWSARVRFGAQQPLIETALLGLLKKFYFLGTGFLIGHIFFRLVGLKEFAELFQSGNQQSASERVGRGRSGTDRDMLTESPATPSLASRGSL